MQKLWSNNWQTGSSHLKNWQEALLEEVIIVIFCTSNRALYLCASESLSESCKGGVGVGVDLS